MMTRRKKPVSKMHQWLATNPLRKHIDALQRPRGAGRDVAASIGCKKQTMYQWLGGKAKPGFEYLAAIQTATGITPEQWQQWWRNEPKKGKSTCSSP